MEVTPTFCAEMGNGANSEGWETHQQKNVNNMSSKREDNIWADSVRNFILVKNANAVDQVVFKIPFTVSQEDTMPRRYTWLLN